MKRSTAWRKTVKVGDYVLVSWFDAAVNNDIDGSPDEIMRKVSRDLLHTGGWYLGRKYGYLYVADDNDRQAEPWMRTAKSFPEREVVDVVVLDVPELTQAP